MIKKKLHRHHLLPFLKDFPSCTMAMEACGGSNDWYRQCQCLGHQVRLISPQFIKPFVNRNKNDFNDALAIVDALSQLMNCLVSPKRLAC